MRYFHGGIPDLRPGDLILPPDKTGTDHRLSAYITDADRAPHARRTDVVYLTAARNVARVFAALYPDGALYQVEPCGPVEPDPDCLTPEASWQCAAARVVAVVDAVVLFRDRPVEAWLRMLDRCGDASGGGR